jgi:hypothetical protein
MGESLITHGLRGPKKILPDFANLTDFLAAESVIAERLKVLLEKYFGGELAKEEESQVIEELKSLHVPTDVLDYDMPVSVWPNHVSAVGEFVQWWNEEDRPPNDVNYYMYEDFTIMVAGEMTWGDTPSGDGFTMMEYLIMTGTYKRLGLV